MAYGSPDRLEDVPAYYADIRGGRPIAPEHLADLVARYRRLGIEDSNPLNEITEATRAALEAELGLPVFTGMRHWRRGSPRRSSGRSRAAPTTIVGLVLAPHYSSAVDREVPGAARGALAGRAELRFVERWGAEPGFVELLAERLVAQNASTSSSPRTRFPRGSSTRAIRTATSCSRRRGSSPRRPASTSGRSPSRASRRPASRGSARTSSSTSNELAARGVRDVVLCPVGFVADHLEIRWDLDVEAAERARELGLRLDRIELPNADPAFVARARRARPACRRCTVCSA